MYSNSHHNFSTLKEEHKELLPGLTPPYQDELLSSWLYRLAQRHDIKVHIFIKYLFFQIKKISFYSAKTKKIFQKELPQNTQLITDSIQLIQEAQINKHCLASYQKSIEEKYYISFILQQEKKHINIGFFIEKLNKSIQIKFEQIKFEQARSFFNEDERNNPLVLSFNHEIISNPIIKKAIETEYFKKHKK